MYYVEQEADVLGRTVRGRFITPTLEGRCSLFHSSPSPFFSLQCPLINVFKDSLLHCGRQWTPRTRSHKHTSASFRKGLRFEMSESNDPQRFEALESNATEKQGQMSELMKMMRQLTQTRTAGFGQREEESGGTGRGAAHNYSGGAGKVPPTADTGYSATAVAEVPAHTRVASEPGRPADDTSRRPVLPAGAGPMIDVQHGEARVRYLAGIAAHGEGGGVLTDVKSLPARVVLPVLEAEKGGFQKFKHEFLLKSNMLDTFDHFVGQRMRMVPVGDPLKPKAALLREGCFERGDQRCIPGVKFYRCSSSE